MISRIESMGYPQSPEEWAKADQLLRGPREIPLNDSVTALAISVRHRKVKIPDAIVAASAIHLSLPLVSRNIRNFSNIEELAVINPFEDAVNELNGFPNWLTEITASHSDAVLKVLAECVAAEWDTPANDEHFHGVFSNLAYGPPEFRRLSKGVVLDKLSQTEPPNFQVLRAGLKIARSCYPSPRKGQQRHKIATGARCGLTFGYS